MSSLPRGARAAILALLVLITAAPAASATTTIRFLNPAGDRGSNGTARLVIQGDGAPSTVTVQRTEGDIGFPGTDNIVLTDTVAADRVADGGDSSDFCTDVSPTQTYCRVLDSATVVSFAGSTLGGGNDSFTVVPAAHGDELDLEIDGGAGDDTLVGAAGDDALLGGEGSDFLQGNAGADTFSDAGTAPGDVDTVSYNDTAHAAAGVNVTIDDGNANDGADGVDGPTAADQVSAGIDKVVGTDFNDLIFGSALGDTIVGGLGVDTLLGSAGDDRIEARDGTTDSTVDCGDGTDTAITDGIDPAAKSCETEDRSGAGGGGGGGGGTTAPLGPSGPTTFAIGSTGPMPDLRDAPYRGLSFGAMEYELRRSFWSVLAPVALTYQQAAARAGRAKVRPYDVLAQSPNPGAQVRGSALEPLVVRAFYWDPAKDAVKQPCDPRARLRASGATPVPLAKALRGLEFREGTAGREGAAQNLLRRVGCPYDAKVTYSARAKDATVRAAKAATLTRKVRSNGKVTTTRVKGFALQVTAPRNGNDFLTTFTEPLNLRANELPLSTSLQLPAGRTVRAAINTRETATGRIAEGTVVELTAPGGGVLAKGRTDAEGMVSLTGFIAAPGAYELYLSRERRDPATGDVVVQEGILELAAVTPGDRWTGVAGTAYTRKGSGFAKAAAVTLRQRGAGAPGTFALRFAIDIGRAANVRALADAIAAKAGLTAAEREALAVKLAAMSGIADDSPARALFGIRRVQLVPGIGAVKAGRLCPQYKAPEIRSVSANAYAGGGAIPGTAQAASFDCGRAVLIDPATGLMLAGPNNVLGGELIANDGTTLMSNHGMGIISNHSGALVSDNGGGIVSNHSTGLIANDGTTLVPVTKLLANDGASIISNKGGGLQPVGGGTTFLPAGR